MSDSVNFRNDLLSKQMFLSIGFMIRLRGGAPVINRLESPWKLVRYLTNLTIVKLDLFAPTWLWKISSKFYSTSCFHIFFLVESPKLSLQATFFLVESPFSYGFYRQRGHHLVDWMTQTSAWVLFSVVFFGPVGCPRHVGNAISQPRIPHQLHIHILVYMYYLVAHPTARKWVITPVIDVD